MSVIIEENCKRSGVWKEGEGETRREDRQRQVEKETFEIEKRKDREY